MAKAKANRRSATTPPVGMRPLRVIAQAFWWVVLWIPLLLMLLPVAVVFWLLWVSVGGVTKAAFSGSRGGNGNQER